MIKTGIDWNFEGYKEEAHFFICGAFESFEFIRDFLETVKKCPWLLKDNVIIDSAFGSPTCVWNGGRTLTNIYYDKQQLKNIRDTYLNLGIKIRFIFTNSLLNEYDLHDRYCNLLMDIFEDISPEVVVNSPILESYLRNKYPSASFISSTTKRLRTSTEQLKEFESDYKYICLDYDYNYNFNFLKSIHHKERKRVEILVNSTCPKGCNARVLHQICSSKRQLEYNSDQDNIESEDFYKLCPKINGYPTSSLSKDTRMGLYSGSDFILPQDLDNYIELGFNHFKIQGRELPTTQLFAEFLPYLIKPEFYPRAISIININR